MLTTTRRRLGVALAAAAVAASVAVGLTGCQEGGGTISTVGTVDFATPLAIPALAESTTDAAGRRVFDLTAEAGSSQLLPGKPTATWGFNGAMLGPTIVADRGDDVVVNIHNDLPEPTTVHWHGMHLPAAMDGGPHQLIAAGDDRSPHWTIDQPAATLWYHPHPHEMTEEQVAKGLAGMVILHDPAEQSLGLPGTYGVDDIPVIVQDVRFDTNNQLVTNVRGFVGPIGDQLLVNGTLGPYLDVTTDVVRLRLLNASPARVFNFEFADARMFALVGTDGGLLEAPYQTDHIQLSPGERAEVLVSMTAGESVVLRSTPPDLGVDGGSAFANAGTDSFDVIELRAAATLATVGVVPAKLVSIDRFSEKDADAERTFQMDGTEINSQDMEMGRIDEVVTLGSTEIWDVKNQMGAPHSFHVHDVEFQVLSVGGAPPPPELAGWKDTVYLRPNVQYRLIMQFTDYADPNSPYMYHCHLLAHEDQGMMGQFVVVKPGQHAGTIQGENHDH
ncbi:MAG: multicopper oxidase domain-containing protein [Rhodoglobus sp.]